MNLPIVHRFIRFIIVTIAIIIGVIALYYIATVTYPFLIALGIAFFINPLVNLIEKQVKLPRGLAVLMAIILILGILAGLLTFLVTEMFSGFQYLAEAVPPHFNRLVLYFEELFSQEIMPIYDQLMSMFNDLGTTQRTTIIERIQDIGQKLTDALQAVSSAIVTGITKFVVSLPNLLTVLIISLLATFFISKDWYKYGNAIKKKVPEQALENTQNIYSDLKVALIGFVRAQLTLISITGVIVLIGLLILRVEHAVTIAVITAFVDLLPYLGTGAVFVPWTIYVFITGDTFLAVGLAILYGVVIIQRQLMEPKVLSTSIGLDPLPTLISLFVGFKLLGFLGLIVGPVSLVIIKTLYKASIFKDLWKFIYGKTVK